MKKAVSDLSTLRLAAEELEVLAGAYPAKETKKMTAGSLFAKQISAVDKTVKVVRETFSKILSQLQHLEAKNINESVLEGIGAIIAKAEEVSWNLERYTALFESEVSGIHVKVLKEFLDLKDFYSNLLKQREARLLVAKQALRHSDQEPVFEITKSEEEQFVDFVKSDKGYELFYLKAEDGRPFYDRTFIKHLQFKSQEYPGLIFEDPFIQIKSLQDKELQMRALAIVNSLSVSLSQFIKAYRRYEGSELARNLMSCIVALLMASHSENLLRHVAIKSCHQYFLDFQIFLREVFDSLTFKEWLRGDKTELTPFERAALDLVEDLSTSLYLQITPSKEPVNAIVKLIDRIEPLVNKENDPIQYLEKAYQALDRYFKQFPSGPVLKALDHLLFEEHPGFDPLINGNLPYVLFEIGKQVKVIHIPTPTIQEMVHKVRIAEEFRAFLRHLHDQKKAHLIINLQDRTSWKEHARSTALETLQNEAEFFETVHTVTLAKNTDFYNQEAPYTSHDVKEFIAQFKEQLSSESCGFYFPKEIKKALFDGVIDEIIKRVHKHYFSSKNTLSRRERCTFIDLCYHFIILKLIEITNVDSLSFTCKDGIDASASQELLLYVSQSGTDKDKLLQIATVPSFLHRERLMLPDIFLRTLKAIEVITVMHPRD